MKLDIKKVMWVGFAFMLIQAFWIAYDAIVPLMLVNKFGMNHTWSGLIMALDNILAVFLLPIFGSLSDKNKSKYGKRKPFVLIGTLCAVVAFFGLSFVDYAQLKNLGEQAELPNAYESTVESRKAHEFFWEKDYVVVNSEYSLTNENNNNALGDEVNTHNYVAHILFNKEYDALSGVQKEACKQWYVNIDFNTSFVYDKNSGYSVYNFVDEDTAHLVTVDDDGNIIQGSENEIDKAQDIHATRAYNALITEARSDYAAQTTYENPTTLVLFIFMLLLTLVAMAVFRSPAVALMPDVVVRPLRSKGNAVINLMGTVGGIIVLGMGMIIGTDKINNQLMPYVGYIGLLCLIMLAALAVFVIKVKEPKWHAEMLEEQAAIDAKEEILEKQKAEREATLTAEVPENAEQSANIKEKTKMSRGELVSLIFILLSVAFWYMGYNAVSSKFSLYAINVLNKPYNSVLVVAQVVGVISFFPIGILSGKFGRKKMILAGVAILAVAFCSAIFVTSYTHDAVLYLLFGLAAIGWSTINVNSFPMVVELAGHGDVGKFTGYYYTASMAAQIITPLFSGLIMDLAGSMYPLFIYGTLFVILSFVTMLFVKHGDSAPVEKKTGLELLDVGDD